MTGEERSRATRARAETALVRLVHALGDTAPAPIVLGGLVPEMLARSGDRVVPEHLGTTDVDVLLITHLDAGLDLAAVEGALQQMEFEPDPGQQGWRWRGPVDGHTVQIEFLCDLDEYREGEIIQPAGCRQLAAANLRGTGYVARDFASERLSGRLVDGNEVTVSVRFAGLEGYLLSKCVSARSRAADKDYYDLVYVLAHNRLGGPTQAAQALRHGALADALPSLASTFTELRERFRGTSDSGPRAYAAQALQVTPDADEAGLRADAVDVAGRFIDAVTG